jgi:hypothetical protein
MVFRPLGGVFHRHPVFTTMALDSGDAAVGVLSYNADKDTFDLTHKDGVVQQMGQEIYGHFINNTGSTIENGTAVGFAGANGEIEIQPYIADGTFSRGVLHRHRHAAAERRRGGQGHDVG